VRGRPLQYVFEDSQADPRQTVAIAQKFVSDPKIVAELGDFSSTASMAALSIYQRAGLVQFGFTNSHPNFTKGGDYIWSSSVSQADEQPRLAKYAADLGFKKLAVLYLNTDWGRTSQKLFGDAAKANGAEIVAAEGYQPEEKGLPLDAGARRRARRDRADLLLRRRRADLCAGAVHRTPEVPRPRAAGRALADAGRAHDGDTRPALQRPRAHQRRLWRRPAGESR
jgi:branched-chain amino acid transport system substrate-binding protein